jgi:hypothetical protein
VGLWSALESKKYPRLVVANMNAAIQALRRAVAKENVSATSQAAIDIAQSALDLELLYRGNVDVDRFHLHAQQLRAHAAAKDAAGVASEVAALEWIRDRIAGSFSGTRLADLDDDLRLLRITASAGNLAAAADIAARSAAEVRRG